MDTPGYDTSMFVSAITATYNRVATLPRLAISLAKQDIDLEWIVVDDGSTDGTIDVLDELAEQAPFPVRIISQQNAGKHVALNRGIPLARGEMAALIDSDDELLPGALARLSEHWHSIPAAARDGFFGVTGRCVDERGQLIGNQFPGRTAVDCSWQESVYFHHSKGERFGLLRTDVLRDHPFPEPSNQSFVVEGMIWRQIGQKYLTRYVDDPVRIYYTAGDDRLSRRPFASTAGAQLSYYTVQLCEDLRWFRSDPTQFVRAAAQYTRANLHEGVPLPRQAAVLPKSARVLWFSALPLGMALWLRDRIRAGG
jgi:glycosyltransferase involved in cell wall biosynthesis